MKKVLFITHIAGFLNPGNGGQLRTYHVLKSLGKSHCVNVYCDKLSKSAELTETWNELGLNKFVSPIKAVIFRRLSRKRFGARLISLAGRLIHRNFIKFNELPTDVLNIWLNDFVKQSTIYDVVILDTLEQYPLFDWRKDKWKVWLNAHNVESILNPNNLIYCQLESKLAVLIDGVICCTQNDESRFKKLNSSDLQTITWANGTIQPTTSRQEITTKPNSALFVGTLNYKPNIEGVRWYLQKIHPQLCKEYPDYQLTVVGRNPENSFLAELKRQAKVRILPDVKSLSELYFSHSVAVVPLQAGSGSRLKIPESLIHGCPVISTAIGAEGYNNSTLGLTIADTDEEFKKSITQIFRGCNLKQKEITSYAQNNFTWKNTIQLDLLGL